MGWKTEDMLKGLPGVMNLATAFGEDLESVSVIVTGTMDSFGIQAGESARLVDVLAQASVSSNTSLDMMGKAFYGAGPAAAAFGYSMEDVAIAAGLMANAGIQGETAGESINTILTNLSEPTKSMERYMQKLSVSLKNSTGDIKPLGELLEKLRSGFSGLSEAQKEEYAAGIAGKDGMAGLLAIMNGSDEEFLRLKEAIDQSTGAADRLSAIRMDNLAGDISLFKGAYENIELEVYSGISEELREIVQEATKWISGFAESLEEGIPTALRIIKQFADRMRESFGSVLDTGKWFLNHSEVIKGGITGIVAAFATFKAANIGIGLAGGMSAAIGAWPVALAGIVIGGIAGIGVAIKEANDQAIKSNLKEHFGDITLSVKELNEAAKNTLGSGLFQSIDQFKGAGAKSKDIFQSMKRDLHEIAKTKWNLSVGIEFDEEDSEAYEIAIQNYLQGAQDYVDSKGYELSLAIDLVFGGSKEGEQLKNSSGTFYQSTKKDLYQKRNEINKLLEQKEKDGLSKKEEEELQVKQDEALKLVELITQSENQANFEMLQWQITDPDLSGDSFQNYQQAILDFNSKAMENIDDAYSSIITSLIVQKKAGENGLKNGIDEEQYNELMNNTKQSYYRQKLQVTMNGYSAMKDVIADHYGPEIEPVLTEVQNRISEELEAMVDKGSIYTPQAWQEAFNKVLNEATETTDSLGSTKGAVYKLLENLLKPEQTMGEIIELYKNSGGNVYDKDILAAEQSMDNTKAWRAVSGSDAEMWKLIGDEVGKDIALSTVVMSTRETEAIYMDEFIDAIREKFPLAETAAKELNDSLRNSGENYKGTSIPVNYETAKMITKKLPEQIPEIILWKNIETLKSSYQANNYSDLYNSMVSSGSPVINEDNTSFAPVFSPTIYVNGNTMPSGQIPGVIRMTYEQFKSYLERYNHEQFRVAFRR
ncbi:phage tail tape measure protein [Lacrimispora sp.]|uniref:phage tail tape measure protein n=1 Tax=Lacrimispora sp. TaxID=2719234 RepID=UPI0028A9EEDA|nr:phage tail tape measure protein [Lacrimispora sp.]